MTDASNVPGRKPEKWPDEKVSPKPPTQDRLDSIVLTNCAPERQIRWSTCVVPNYVLDQLPDASIVDGAVCVPHKQPKHGRLAGGNVYVLADLAGGQSKTLHLNRAKPIQLGMPSLSALAPDPTQVGIQIQVGQAVMPLRVKSIDSSNPFRTRIHLRGSVEGHWCDLWCDVWAWQDSIDITGSVTYSDRSSDSLEGAPGEDVILSVQQGTLHADYEIRWGIRDGDSRLVPMDSSDKYPDGFRVPFYGVWQPNWPEMPEPDDALNFLFAERGISIVAARAAPITAMYDLWYGSFFALKYWDNRVTGNPQAEHQRNRFATRLGQPGEQWHDKEYANPRSTGQAGNQPPFGFWKDEILLNETAPSRLWQLRESAADICMRGHHHLDLNGDPVKAEDHPNWYTWNGMTHQLGSDKLGKPLVPWGFGFGRAHCDDQHFRPTYPCTVAHLTDDPLLEASFKDWVQTSAARAFRKQGRKDEPRSGGRLLANWAQIAYVIHDEETRDLCIQLAIEEFEKWNDWVDTPSGRIPRKDLGLVRPCNVIQPDRRVLSGGPAWRPWQDMLMCVGTIHLYELVQAVRPVVAQRMLDYVVEVAETSALWGTVRDGDGTLWPLTGVLWLPNGEANGQDYYTFPRQGADFSNAYDMLVGTPGWFNAMGLPGVFQWVLSKPGGNPEARTIMKEVVDGNRGGGEWSLA